MSLRPLWFPDPTDQYLLTPHVLHGYQKLHLKRILNRSKSFFPSFLAKGITIVKFHKTELLVTWHPLYIHPSQSICRHLSNAPVLSQSSCLPSFILKSSARAERKSRQSRDQTALPVWNACIASPGFMITPAQSPLCICTNRFFGSREVVSCLRDLICILSPSWSTATCVFKLKLRFRSWDAMKKGCEISENNNPAIMYWGPALVRSRSH